MNALDKAKTMQERAEFKTEQRKAHRQKVWGQIKSDYPDCADIIERVTKWSGRLAGVSIEVDGKEILNSEYPGDKT